MHDDLTMRAANLHKTFGEGTTRTHALQDVSLELQRGQLALLMGPSGSGKSTLLAVLSGLLRPDAGKVLIAPDGTWTDLWALTDRQREQFRRRHFGFIFQGYNLFPALTACEQLEIVLRWGEGMSAREARRRSEEMLDKLGMRGRLDKLPVQLSGGEKQRVAIGRALVKRPQFVFADEPTSALDWKHGEQVVELLRAAAHDEGATIVVVSHDQRLLPLVDVTFHLEDGKLTTEPESVAYLAN